MSPEIHSNFTAFDGLYSSVNYKAPQDSHLLRLQFTSFFELVHRTIKTTETVCCRSMSLYHIIRMPYVMRISLSLYINGHLVAWHDHLISKVNFQLWTIAYPSQQGRVGYVEQRDRVLTGTTECSSRSLTSHV